MPGEQLMCIWQAVLAKDVFPESGVKRATLMSVVENFHGISGVTYTERRFMEVFTEQKPTFDDVKRYVDSSLRSPSASTLLVMNDMEAACWEMSETSYESEALNESELKKMWYIFNRMCVANSYPAVISKNDADWLFEKLAKSMEKTWGSKGALPEQGLTFQQMINMLDRMYFSVTSTSRVRESIDEMHNWLVAEIMKTGWLTKRTRKASNWTNWLKRWFVMVPGKLTYYETNQMRVRKGEVLLERESTVENLADYKGILTKLANRFKVSNKASLEIELCAETSEDKLSWLSLIHKNLDAVRSGVTPITALLRERNTSQPAKPQSQQQLDVAQQVARRVTMRSKQPSTEKASPSAASTGNRPEPSPPRMRDDDGVYDNATSEIQRDKVRAVFMEIDSDGNGRIDRGEFFSFLKNLGADISQREADVLFNSLDKDGNQYICFEEFYECFLRMVMGQSNSEEEARLRSAFMQADRDGSGAVSFREFAEFAYSMRRSIAMDDLVQAFDNLDVDKTGEIDFQEFRSFFEEQGLIKDVSIDPRMKTSGATLEEYLKDHYSRADASQLAGYLRSRWKAFASFKRTNKEGKLVMTGAPGMVADVVPGSYNLIDLAMFNDLPPITPKYVAVKGVTWNASNVPNRSGRVVFPADFDGKLPVEVATNEHLAYYGATLATGNQLQVSLLYRHGIQDFTYQNDYLEAYVTSETALGGAGIERHDFAHLDCPLEDDSGTFIIAKHSDDGEELHITGFKIPTRHTLYLPGGVIHSNDYLRGTWRTMLSDEAEIDHVQLVRQTSKGKNESFEKFIFTFES